MKDRTCLRALEKIKNQLEKGNKEYGDHTVAAAQDGSVMTTIYENEGGNNILTCVFTRVCHFHLY